MSDPRTDAGRRLLRMFETTEGPRHSRWPRAFDARLTERIVEEFVPMIEAEAAQLGATISVDIIPPDWHADDDGYARTPLRWKGAK